MSTLEETIVGCVVEAEGCCDVETRDIVGIIETIVKHESKIRRLLKTLKRAIAKCCATTNNSSGEETV
jgi:hypothetical protein